MIPQVAPNGALHDALHEALRRYFGLGAFRPGQREALEHLLAGRDLLTVMPTGSGKSLIYQLAALLLPGMSLVISPLVALMKDQVDGLTRCTTFARAKQIDASAVNPTRLRTASEARLY